MLPVISVVIPCYNQAKFLSEALDSVLAQTYVDWECVVVDDGSIDNTRDVAMMYCTKDVRVKYIYQSNAGLSAARNAGVGHSLGRYILPLDSDDIIGENYMKLAMNVFENNDKLTIVYSRANLFGVKKGEWKLPAFSIERMLGRNCIFCSAFYRRVDFDRVGGYNTNMKYGFEDWDFWLSLLQEGGEVYHINEILFFYRIRRRSMLNSIDMEKDLFLRRQIWANHRNLYAEYMLDPIESFEYNRIVESRAFALMSSISKLLKKILFWVNTH